MKRINHLTIVCVLLICTSVKAQVVFTYDNGGNMIERKIIVNPNQNARFNFNQGKNETVKDSVLAFKVYPNPANDVINIEGIIQKGETTAQIFLRNNNGMLIIKDNYEGVLKSIKVNDLAAGIYFLEIEYEKKKSANYKIIITN